MTEETIQEIWKYHILTVHDLASAMAEPEGNAEIKCRKKDRPVERGGTDPENGGSSIY